MGCGSWQIDAIDIMIYSIYHCSSTTTRISRLMSMLRESIKEIVQPQCTPSAPVGQFSLIA